MPGAEAVTDQAVDRASAADVSPLSRALGAAFADDPVMSWLLPEATGRDARLSRLFATFLRGHFLRLGSVWRAPDNSAAALWAPPGQAIVPPVRIARQLPAVFRTFGPRALRALRAFEHVERHHPKEPHWYLGVLGTRPDRQGRGVGSALLRPVLGRCDAEGLPAYLESSKESNIAFYHRAGFRVLEELPLPDGGPPVWPMWREPRPG